MALKTDWEGIATLSRLCAQMHPQTHANINNYGLYSDRMNNYCTLGKKEFTVTSTSILEGGLYTYQFVIGNLYDTMYKYNNDALQQDLAYGKFSMYHDVGSAVPMLKKVRVVNADTDDIVNCMVHNLGNPVDCIRSRELYDKLYKYFDITDKSYIPLASYTHPMMCCFYGTTTITIDTTKQWVDPRIELEFCFALPNIIDNNQNNQNNILNTETITNNDVLTRCYKEVDKYDAIPTDLEFALNTLPVAKMFIYYFPTIRNHHQERSIHCWRGMMTILTSEKTNSVLKFTLEDREGRFIGESCVASSCPGVYELLPIPQDSMYQSLRKFNNTYNIEGRILCDKPVLATIDMNFRMHSDGMAIMRFAT